MSEDSNEPTVAGERNSSTVFHGGSMQARAQSVLVAGLMIALGLGMLTWYYTSTLTRQAGTGKNARAMPATPTQGDMPLPPLGHVAPPQPLASAVTPVALAEPPIDQAPASRYNTGRIMSGEWSVSGYGSEAATGPQTEFERQLSGAAFARGAPQTSEARSAAEAATDDAGRAPATLSGPGTEPALGLLLRPQLAGAVQAQLLPTQRFLLAKGAFIDCTLETAIDSTLPGMTTCITATDTFGVDGKVVLLERGTKLIGETRGQVQQGAARVFVLWTEARTPSGVVVPLASPGTDELGRSGLPGTVDRHFLDRFGAAMLISVINGAVQSAVQQSRSAGGAIVYNPSASQDVLTEVLKSTINIAPTVLKQHGDRIQVFVARNLDFRPVYELRPSAAGR